MKHRQNSIQTKTTMNLRHTRFLISTLATVWTSSWFAPDIVLADCGPAGQVVTWGSLQSCHVPSGCVFSNIVAGHDHNLATMNDGMVVGWGRNEHGQVTVPIALTN